MKVIGFSGYARCGKDEAAAVLEKEFGYTRVSFADKLREMLYALNPMVNSYGYNSVPRRVQDVIEQYGWSGYKETKYAHEIRALLQRLGTQAGRQILGDDIWVEAAFSDLDPGGKYVFADCRFPNEAMGVLARGGDVIRINRKDVGPVNYHESETSLDTWGFDLIVSNDGTLDEFHDKIRRIL